MKDRKDYIIEALQQQVMDLQQKLTNILAEANMKLAEKDEEINQIKSAKGNGQAAHP